MKNNLLQLVLIVALVAFVPACKDQNKALMPQGQTTMKGTVEIPADIDVKRVKITAGVNQGTITKTRKNGRIAANSTSIEFSCVVAQNQPQLVFLEDLQDKPLMMCISYGSNTQPLVIDLQSTANCLLLLHPFLVTSDLIDAQKVNKFIENSQASKTLKTGYEAAWKQYSGVNLPGAFDVFQRQPWVVSNAWLSLEKDIFQRFVVNPDDLNGVNLADVKLNTQTKELSFVVENSRRRWLQIYVDKYDNNGKLTKTETFNGSTFENFDYLLKSPDAYEGFEGVYDLYNRYVNKERLKETSNPLKTTTTGFERIEVGVYGLGFSGFPIGDKQKMDRMLLPSALSVAMNGVIPTLELIAGVKAGKDAFKLSGRNSSKAFAKFLLAFAGEVIKPEFEQILYAPSIEVKDAKSKVKGVLQGLWDFMVDKDNAKLATDALQELFPDIVGSAINAIFKKVSVYYAGYEFLMGAYNLGDFLYTIITGQSVMTYPFFVGEPDLPKGLVAEYLFENNATDNAKNGFDGVVKGNVRFVSGSNGKGMAADFSSGFNNAWIEVNKTKSLGLQNGHTISFWVKFNNFDANKTYVSWSTYLDTKNNWVISSYGKPPSGFIDRSKSTNLAGTACLSYFDGVASPTDKNWHHIVTTAGDTWERGYIDGKLSYSFGCDYLPLSSNRTQLYMGLYGNTGQYQLDGALDNFRIYNRRLNDAEVLALYDLHKPKSGRVGADEQTTNGSDAGGLLMTTKIK